MAGRGRKMLCWTLTTAITASGGFGFVYRAGVPGGGDGVHHISFRAYVGGDVWKLLIVSLSVSGGVGRTRSLGCSRMNWIALSNSSSSSSENLNRIALTTVFHVTRLL